MFAKIKAFFARRQALRNMKLYEDGRSYVRGAIAETKRSYNDLDEMLSMLWAQADNQFDRGPFEEGMLEELCNHALPPTLKRP